MDARGRGIDAGMLIVEVANLILHAGIDPDRALQARKRAHQLRRQRSRVIESSPQLARVTIHVDARVRLRGSGDAADLVHVDVRADGQDRHHAIERVGPHDRRREHVARLVATAHARSGAVDRQVAIEIQRVPEDDSPLVAVDVDDDRAQALRATVKAEI